MSVDSFCFLLHRFYPDIDQDHAFRQFKQLATVKPDRLVKKLKLNKHQEKYVLCSLPMGFGKTGATIKYLKRKRFIWITPSVHWRETRAIGWTTASAEPSTT